MTIVASRARARQMGSLCALAAIGALGAACVQRSSDSSPTAAQPSEDPREGATGTMARSEDGQMQQKKAGAPTESKSTPTSTAAASALSPPLDPDLAMGVGGGFDHGSAMLRRIGPTGLGQAGGGSGGLGFGSSSGAPTPVDSLGFRRSSLDPNARYATTYRPGGAALAAFDAALARGSIPAVDRDLVADFGARYAPPIEVPEGAAMAFLVETERGSASPSGGAMNLRIAMRSSEAVPTRAPLSVHLVLDVSGSMAGAAITNARAATEALVDKLDPADDFSMVTFSSDAHLLVPDGPVGPRRAAILSKIHDVHADGGTNISSGLDLGYAQAHSASIGDGATRIVMLLSDGHANAGDTNPQSLAGRSARAFQDGIQTSSFGLGADYDAPLMSSFADRGAGGYYYLADSTQISGALERELDERIFPVAQALEIRVRLRPDIIATKVFGSRQLSDIEALHVRQQEVAVDGQAEHKDDIARDRQTDAQGGMRFFIPAFARADHDSMLLTVQLPPGVGERAIGSVELKYKDRLAHRNVTQELPVHIQYAESDGDSAASTNVSVEKTVQIFGAGDAILNAADFVDRGDRASASRLLDERADILKQASTDLNAPALMDEGVRLARLASAVSGTDSIQDVVPLAIMLRGSGYGSLK